MEEREVKILTKVFFAISVIIGSVFLFFIWGINRVEALTSSASNWYVNGNKCIQNDWSGVGTLSCMNNANSNRDYTLRTNANMTMVPGKKYTFMYKATVTANFGSANSWTSNITNMYVSYNRNGTLGDVTSCEHTYSSTNYSDKKVYTIQATCKDVQFSQNTDGFVIRVYFHNTQPVSGNGMVAKISQIYLEETGTDNSDITNTIDNSTTEIINNNNNNTQAIINANGAIGDAINSTINGMKDSIIESGKVCQNYNFGNEIDKSIGFLTDTGGINTSFSYIYHTTNFIKVQQGETYNLILNYQTSSPSYCLYKEDKTLISCERYNNRQNITITPSENGYIKYSINMLGNYNTTFKGKFCQNGNQSIFDKIGELYGIDDWEHENPDKSKEEELEGYEDDLADYLVDDSDISNLDYSVDTTTNQLIWQIFTNTIQQNQVVFTAIISILFLGVIKLLLAR